VTTAMIDGVRYRVHTDTPAKLFGVVVSGIDKPDRLLDGIISTDEGKVKACADAINSMFNDGAHLASVVSVLAFPCGEFSV